MHTPDEVIKVLHVDDAEDFAETTAAHLRREDARLTVETATGVSEALEHLDGAAYDCIVSDFDMPERNGIEFLKTVRESDPNLPFILYTGKGGEEVASDAIGAGVTDYLQKERGTAQYEVLANRITNAVEKHRAQTELAERDEELNLFFEQSPLGVIQWNENFEVVRMNERAESILGYEEATLRGEGWEEIVPESDREQVGEVVYNLLENDGGFHSLNENVRADGSRILCEWHNRIVTDSAGDVVAIFSQFQDVTDREEKIRRLETLVDTLPGIVYKARNEPTWPMDYVRGECEALTGYTAGELEGSTVTWGEDIIHPDDQRETWEIVQEALEEHRPFELTYRIRTNDGELRYVWERGEGIYGPNGDVIALEGFITDITERREREQELMGLRDRMSFALDTTDSVLYEIDLETHAENRHGPFERIYGVSEDSVETVEDFYEKAVHPDDRERLEERQTEIIEQRQAAVEVEYRTHPDNGPIRWMRSPMAVLHPDADDENTVVIGLATDITDLKDREIELGRYETIIETSGDPMYTLDEDGHITYVNDALVSMSGYERERLLGSHASIVMTEEHVARGETTVRSLLKGEQERGTFEMDLVTARGQHIPCENHIGLLPGDEGIGGTVGILRDITERTEREEQLRRQNERLGEFANVVSHDLRNPLNVAAGRLELARDEPDEDHLDVMENALERMEVLIEDLLTLAKEGSRVDDTESVDLGNVAGNCWENVQTANASLQVETTQRIEADPNRLGQVLENLLRNAVEHGGDEVTIRIGAMDEGFYVADDGPGIPEDRRVEIFESGYSTSDTGTGFGLSIAAEIADAHGWALSVTDSEDCGARFEIRNVAVLS